MVYPFQTASARDRAVAAGRGMVAKWAAAPAAPATTTACVSGDCQGGQGVLEYRQGGTVIRTYVGDFRGGSPHGRGSITFADGDIYAGSWTSGRRRGTGVYHHASGRTFVGSYTSDVDAEGAVVEADGTVRNARLVGGSYVFD